MTEPRLVTAYDVLEAWESVLDEHMPQIAARLGWTNGTAKLDNEGQVRTWKAVPSFDAIDAAGTPCGAMMSPGLADEPRKNGDRTHDASWQVIAAVYDRGRDYGETQLKVHRWAALVRAATLATPSLGGVVKRLNWLSEAYDVEAKRGAARTLGGCAIAFRVHLENVVDLRTPNPVTRTSTTVTVTPRSN